MIIEGESTDSSLPYLRFRAKRGHQWRLAFTVRQTETWYLKIYNFEIYLDGQIFTINNTRDNRKQMLDIDQRRSTSSTINPPPNDREYMFFSLHRTALVCIRKH